MGYTYTDLLTRSRSAFSELLTRAALRSLSCLHAHALRSLSCLHAQGHVINVFCTRTDKRLRDIAWITILYENNSLLT